MDQITIALDIKDTLLCRGLTQLISQIESFSIVENVKKAEAVLTDNNKKDGQGHYIRLPDQISPRQYFPDLANRIRQNRSFDLGAGIFFPAKRKIECSGDDISLTDLETELLIFLYQHKNENCTKDMLLKQVWDYHADVTTHTVETHIYRLRQKSPMLEEIITTRDNGYMLYLKDERE